MNSAIQNANLVISSVEETDSQIKIKDEQGHTWSFFKTKKDGSPTVAFEQFGQYKVGELVGVGYKLAGQKNNIRSIMTFQPPMKGQQQISRPGVKLGATGALEKPERNFEKEAYMKCCSIWIEAQLVHQVPLANIEAALNHGFYWHMFQLIQKDADKRFAKGWDKAVKTFAPEEGLATEEPPLEAYNDPS